MVDEKEKDKNNPFSVRLEPEEKKKLIQFIDESGKNNKEFMTSLINLYELNKVKIKNIDLIGDINKLEVDTSNILKRFNDIIETLEGQKTHIIEESSKELSLYKEKVNNVHQEIHEVKLDNARLKEMFTDVDNVNKSLKEQLQHLQESSKQQIDQLHVSVNDKSLLVEEYKGKNDMLLGQLKQYEKYPEQLEEVRKLLTDSQTRNAELSDTVKEHELSIGNLMKEINTLNTIHDNEISSYKKEIHALKAEHDKSIKTLETEYKKTFDTLIQKHTEEVKTLKDRHEIEKERAVLKIQQEMQQRIQALHEEYNNKVSSYQRQTEEMNTRYNQLLKDYRQQENKIKDQQEEA